MQLLLKYLFSVERKKEYGECMKYIFNFRFMAVSNEPL
jgi:hypothetical protein